MIYYFDDDSVLDHWQTKECANDEEALKWALSIKRSYRATNSILYTDAEEGSDNSFRTIQKWEE